uniref:Uncharacterized protein n=1 Tax=Panagrolaimus superbus TaxID=310955 RepID=A0A914Y124_9BILA
MDPSNKFTFSTHGDNKVATKNAVQCFNFNHRASHIAATKYFPTMNLTVHQQQSAQSRNGNELHAYLISKLTVRDLAADIDEKTKKLSLDLIQFSGIDGNELIYLTEGGENQDV